MKSFDEQPTYEVVDNLKDHMEAVPDLKNAVDDTDKILYDVAEDVKAALFANEEK